ncbi:MAG TPA: glycosyl hydrolase [Pirellulales bacterium]|nr:glycosyl hydrolase [Pirellulales bacterium]
MRRLTFLILLIVSTTAIARAADLAWPTATAETKPWSRWWWLGNITTEDGLKTAMEQYAAAGLGGLEITPIYGVKGEEDKFIRYLSPEWVSRFEYVLKEGKRLGLVIDMTTGTGWPFGGPWVTPDDTCKYLAHKTFTVKAGEKLSEPVTMIEKAMISPRSVNISQIKEPFGDTPDLQKLAIENLKMPDPLKLNLLMAFSDQGGEPLNLTDKVAADGKLDWTAPADSGTWTLYAVFNGLHSRMVKRAAPGGEGHTPDHFSTEAISHYLAKLDEALKDQKLDNFRAFFCDSFEIDNGTSGEANFTPHFFDEFQHRRGYDLRPHLPTLLGAKSGDEYTRLLCDYRETISDLLLDNFTSTWRQWAAGHGKIIRNQAHGSPGNVLDLYGAADIPETEGFGNPGGAEGELNMQVAMMYASSAAHVLGKRLASSETCTWLDDHFLTTLAHAQERINTTLLAGINHILYHGTPYSPPDEAWPGFLFYAAVEFCPANSWWDDFAALNKYVERCQSFLQAGQPDNDVLVYAPFYDRWMQPGDGTLPHFPIGGNFPAQGTGRVLLKAGYSFDFVSDRQLNSVTFADGALRTGGVSYRAIVLPETKYLPLATLEKLFYLAQQGATIIVEKALPTDVPGWNDLDKRRAAFQTLLKSLPAAEAKAGDVNDFHFGSGQILIGPKLPDLLAQAAILPETMVKQGLQYVRRQGDGSRVYFVVNQGDKPIDGWAPLTAEAKFAALFDPMTGAIGLGAVRPGPAHGSEVYLQLAAGQSCLIKTFQLSPGGAQWQYVRPHDEAQPLTGKWDITFIKGGPELPAAVQIDTAQSDAAQSDKLQSWTQWNGDAGKAFSGTAKYTLKFAKPTASDAAVTSWRLDLGKVADSARVTLNGKELATLIGAPFCVDIPADQLQGDNTLEISVSNLMANRIADMDQHDVQWKRFYNANVAARDPANRGSNNVFSAAKWEPRASGLMGPVTMTPLEKFEPSAR